MDCLKNRKSYVAPQTEIIVFQLESNFMGTTTFSSSFSFGESGVEDGGDI